jgi:hypothetical protein
MHLSLLVPLVLLVGALLSAFFGAVTSHAPRTHVVLAAGLLGLAALDGALTDGTLSGDGGQALVATIGAVLAVTGGSLLTTQVFAQVDRDSAAPGVGHAGEILRGGAWIGGLERIAVYATLLAGWPGGVAIVLGLKGLGRYPELRNQENTGAAERFIIGTFTSVLWAAACAGVVRLLAA